MLRNGFKIAALLLLCCSVITGCDSSSRSSEASSSAGVQGSEGAEKGGARVTVIRTAAESQQQPFSERESDTAQGLIDGEDGSSMESTVLVYGRVTNAEGNPAANVTVSLHGFRREEVDRGISVTDFTAQASVSTGEDGRYELRGAGLLGAHLRVSGNAPAMFVQLEHESLRRGLSARGVTRIQQDIKLLEGHTITGTVVDGGGTPLPGVPIRLLPHGTGGKELRSPVVSQTTTTESGGFSLDQVASGEWRIAAAHPEYAPVVQLMKVPTTGPLTLRLDSRGGSIAGRVVHKDTGAAAGGVEIKLVQEESSLLADLAQFATRSSSDGTFRFDHLSSSPKSFRVDMTAPRLGLARPIPQNLSVADGQTTEVTLFVYPGHTVMGRVFDKDTGEPLAGAKISTAYVGRRIDTVSDESGNYKLPHVLSVGPAVHLSVELKGYAMPDHAGGSPRVSLPEDKFEVSHDFPMIKKVTIRGVVVNEADKPIPHANVHLVTQSSFRSSDKGVPVEKDGIFELEAPPFTTVLVEAVARGFGTGKSSQMELTVEDVDGLKIVMEPGAVISGRVLGPDGKPVAGASVGIKKEYGSWSTVVPAVNSGEDGTYTISDAPRELTLSGTKEGFAKSEEQVLKITPGETRAGVDLHLREGFTISGRVVDRAKKPIRQVHVAARGPSNMHAGDTTDAEGKFELKALSDGIYQVSAYASPNKEMPGIKAGTKDLEIVIDSDIEQQNSGRLVGTVVDEVTEEPITDFEVTGFGGNLTKLKEPGKFEMRGLRTGVPYGITIWAPDYQKQEFSSDPLRAGQTTEQTFRLGKGGAIVGRVVEAGSQKPLPGVVVVNWGNTAIWLRSQSTPTNHTVTDEQGRFVLAPAPSGENSVHVKAKEPYSDAAKTGQVKSEETTDLGDIELSRGGTINGQVVRGQDETGVPNQQVRLWGQGENLTVEKMSTTDEEGRFQFDALPATHYAVSAGSAQKSFSLEPAGTADVKLVLGGVTMKGRILQGDTVVGASLRGEGFGGQVITSNAQSGEYSIEDVLPGTYNFSVYRINSGGHRPVEETVEVPDQPEFVKDFHLPDGRIEVIVVNSAGEPVGGAQVTLTQKSADAGFDQRWLQRTSGRSETDGDGKATFDGLTPGNYGVNAQKEDVGSAANPAVTVQDGQAARVQLQLSSEGGTLVSVALSYTTGQGVREAWCYLHGENGPFTHNAKRDASGVMTITNIPPGNYTTNVSYWSHSQSEKTVEIKANETVTVEDVLYPAGAIHWTIRKADGTAAANATVTVTPLQTDPPEETRTGRTTANGEFVQRGLASGTYQVTAQLDGKPPITETFEAVAGGNVEKQSTAPGW